MKTKKISALIGILTTLSLLLSPISQAQAVSVDSISGGAVNSALDSAFAKMGINQNELRYYTAAFNESRQKKQQPQVELNFNPSNPVPGQKVTVVATPKFFLNDPENLYFTWYLRPNGCPDDDDTSPSSEIKEKCDFNDNGTVNIEDYKVRAMRIIASSGFEWNKKDGSGRTAYDRTSSNGGANYEAIWGGEDQKHKKQHCYIHSTEEGDEYEIECDKHLFPSAPDETTGDDEFGLEEEEFWHTNPDADDTAGTGNGDEANIAGLGITTFTWTYDEGDQVGVVIEGVSTEPAQSDDSSYRTMWALVNNKCNLGDKSYDSQYSGTTSAQSDGSSGVCGEGVIDEKITTYTTKSVVGRAGNVVTVRQTTYSTKITDADCNGVFDEAASAPYGQTTTCPGNYRDGLGLYNGATCTGPDTIVALNDSGLELENIKNSSDLNKCLYANLVDPREGGGQGQKIDIGLTYSPEFPINNPGENSTDGDIINVTSSVLNGENDGYLKYKWEAFASDTPNPEEWGDPISKQHLKEATQTMGVGLNSFQFRLNLTDEALGSRVSKKNRFYLKIKLTVSETVSRSINTNLGDSSNAAPREGYADVVIPISSTAAKIKVFDAVATQENANIKLSPGTVEKCVENITSTICPVTKNEIIAVQAESSLTDYHWTINGKTITPISSDCLSGDCKSSTMESTNIAYFPILGDLGNRYAVNLQAVNSKTGEKMELTKNFLIVEPSVKIYSPVEYDKFRPVLLGHYIDMDGELWPDYSQTDYEALINTTFHLQGDFSGFSYNGENSVWIVDGITITKDNARQHGYSLDDAGTLSLPTKPAGGTYEVSLAALYYQNILTKKALNTFWGITYTDFYEKRLEDHVSIRTTQFFIDNQLSQNGKMSKRILASLYSATPEYLAFLLRIVLTAFVLLISARIIFSYLPNANIKRDETY